MSKCYFFLRLNNIPLYFCITFFKSIHSSMDTELLLLLAFVNNAAMNMVYKHLFEILPPILLDLYPEVELLDHMVIPRPIPGLQGRGP